MPPSREPVLPDGATPGITVLLPVNRWLTSVDAVTQVALRGSGYQRDGWQDQLAVLVPRLETGDWQVCELCRYITDGSCPECPPASPEPVEEAALR